MIDKIIDMILNQTRKNGLFKIPTNPRDERTLKELEIVYAHQAILGIALFPQKNRNDIFRITSAFDMNKLTHPLFDSLLKIKPLILCGKIQEALKFSIEIALMVNDNGHIDFSRRREASALDPLLTLDSLLEMSKFTKNEIICNAINRLCGYLERSTNNTFEIGNDISNWIWCIGLLNQAKRFPNKRHVREILNVLENKLIETSYWSYNPKWQSKHVPHFISPIVYTNHILLNLTHIRELIPSDQLHKLIYKPLIFNFEIYRQMMYNENCMDDKFKLCNSSYNLSLFLRLLYSLLINFYDDETISSLLHPLDIPEKYYLHYSKIDDLTSDESKLFITELNKYLKNIDEKLDVLISNNGTSSSIEWTFPLIPSLINIKRQRNISEKDYPTVSKILNKFENFMTRDV